jgi:hypothetical protein
MTQDQYSQAQDPGYVVGGQVVEDETGEFTDDQDKPMTRFQKVASVLRGDRPERDEPEDAAMPVTDPDGMMTDPNGMAADHAVQPGSPPMAHPDEAAAASRPDSRDTLDAQDTAVTDPDGTTVATGSGTHQGDYWDTQATRGPDQDQVAAVTSPDVPVTDTDSDPLARPDTVAGPDTMTDHETAVGHDTAVDRGAVDPQDPTTTQPDLYPETADTGAGLTAGNAAAVDPAYQDQVGAATISDVPVTEAPDGTAVTEAPGAGRHAAVPAQETQGRPGEATNTLDNLGDLAYGQLLPDSADFSAQWQQVQFKFVDDPHASVTEAAEIVGQVTAKLEAAIAERQRAIAEQQRAIEERQHAIQERQSSLSGRWGEGSEADTETLRETLRMYKAFLDQLVGPRT